MNFPKKVFFGNHSFIISQKKDFQKKKTFASMLKGLDKLKITSLKYYISCLLLIDEKLQSLTTERHPI